MENSYSAPKENTKTLQGNDMKTRKIVLLLSIALLFIVLIIQQIVFGGSKIRFINLKEEPSVIIINKNTEEQIRISKKDDNTFLLNDKLPANSEFAKTMFSQIQSLKILGTVASVSNEAELESFGLHPLSAIVVSALRDEKTVRTLKIGKVASSGAQTYVQIDDSNTVVLVSGALRSYFEKSLDDLLQKEEQADATDDVPDKEGSVMLNNIQD